MKTIEQLEKEIEELGEELGSWCESCGDMLDSKDEWKIKDAQLKTLKDVLELIDERIEHYDLKLDTKSQVALERLKEIIKGIMK